MRLLRKKRKEQQKSAGIDSATNRIKRRGPKRPMNQLPTESLPSAVTFKVEVEALQTESNLDEETIIESNSPSFDDVADCDRKETEINGCEPLITEDYDTGAQEESLFVEIVQEINDTLWAIPQAQQVATAEECLKFLNGLIRGGAQKTIKE